MGHHPAQRRRHFRDTSRIASSERRAIWLAAVALIRGLTVRLLQQLRLGSLISARSSCQCWPVQQSHRISSIKHRTIWLSSVALIRGFTVRLLQQLRLVSLISARSSCQCWPVQQSHRILQNSESRVGLVGSSPTIRLQTGTDSSDV